MLLISWAANLYARIDYEKFTHKVISALSLFEVIESPNLEEDKLEFETDIARIEWLRDFTHKDVMVNLYKLDRIINPSKKGIEKESTTYTFKFIREDAKERALKNENIEIDITPSQAQKYLCMAIEEIDRIVFRNLTKYSDEFAMPTLTTEKQDNMDFLDFKQ